MTAIEFIEHIYLTVGIDRNVNFLQATEMFKQQIKNAYNQGFRDGLIDGKFPIIAEFDISECSNAENYFNKTFNK